MADTTVDTTCPTCEEEFECTFDPEQEINDIDCPECNALLVVGSWDAASKTLTLVETPEECDLCGDPLNDCTCGEDEGALSCEDDEDEDE